MMMASYVREDRIKPREGGDEELDKARKRKEVENSIKSDGMKQRYIESSFDNNKTSDLEFFTYPDPDFNDFDKDRNAERFVAGQVWAAYDYHNVMPRFYAWINRVSSPGFNVCITWLEPQPNDENEFKWLLADLPFPCGEFKYGDSEQTLNRFMFSHEVSWGKGNGGTFLIHPRKGEIWALFRNWDFSWSSDPAAHGQKNEYEYVEILSDYVTDVGIHVALLSQVNGFVSIFCRMEMVGKKTTLVPPGELLRFSHMIPSYKIEGNERGVPVESFELDPAALPLINSMVEGDSDMPMAMMIDENGNLGNEPKIGFSGEQNIWRFSCLKRQVSCKENLTGDCDYVNVSPLKSEKEKISKDILCNEDGVPNGNGDNASNWKELKEPVKTDNASKRKELKEPVKIDYASIDSPLEEALRAREIAEKKMQSKEFVVARKIALDAQQLYPDVENISQLLIVCDVHCSAAQKLSGNEMDWYGILQLGENADEATIKKQYLKFVHQLHHDKNKFAGAKAAFQLITEARTILLDKNKRLLHNMRRKYSKSEKPSTFRTVCPYCAVWCQYYKEVENRFVRCHSCRKCYIANAGSLERIEIPDPEFYNFDVEKFKDKFKPGQIWAFYCDEDGLPKDYGMIKKIEFWPSFKLHISRLVSGYLFSYIIRWSDKKMPVSCGRFEIEEGDGKAYDSVTNFSHLVKAEPTTRDSKNEYDILPKKGEIWALYRNWNSYIKCIDLANCEYDIVEVVSANVLLINVSVLEPVDGFNSVFKARVQGGGSTLTWSIPQIDFFKFSHQIPAFRLTGERGGKIRGFFELDPAALPSHYFCSN